MRSQGLRFAALTLVPFLVFAPTPSNATSHPPGVFTEGWYSCNSPTLGELIECFKQSLDEISPCADAPRFGPTYVTDGPTYRGIFESSPGRYLIHRWAVSFECWDYGYYPEPGPSGTGTYWFHLRADGAECLPGFTLDTSDGSCDFDGPPYALEAPPPPCTPNESNPCNPADGTKTQREIDYDPGTNGALTFARYYRSAGPHKTAPDMAPGWRHTYSRSLNEIPDRRPSIKYPAAANQSSFYATPGEACETGWGDISATVWGGDLSTATASFVGGNTCKVQSGGSAVYLPVRSGIPRTGFSQAANVKTISRPNGSVVVFELDAGIWSSNTHPDTSLEDTGTSWVYTDTNDTKETYDLDGKLVSIEYRNGQTEQLEYDLTTAQGGDGNAATLDRVTGPFGHTILFRRQLSSGRLHGITIPDGVISYSYGSHSNLEYVRYPGNKYREYLYEDPDLPHHLTGIEDENNDRYATWQYDDAGRAIVSRRYGGKQRVDFAYNTNGTTTLTLANGSTRTYDFSVQQGARKLESLTGVPCTSCPDGDIQSRTYDANGYVGEATDWNGNVTKTARNARGLVTTLTEAKGTTEQRVTAYEWHPSFRLPTKVTTPRNVTDYVYDTDGNPTSITVSGGGKTRVWAFTYNTHGQMLTIDGPRTDVSDVTTLAYYTCTTGAECGQLQSITNALSQVTSFDSYDASGRVTQMTDPNGLQTSLTYDDRGNLLSITETPTTGSARMTTHTYDKVNQLKTVTTPAGVVLTYAYDAAHYLDSITDNLGNKIVYTYDAMGNQTGETRHDPGNQLRRSLAYTFDLNNRLDTITDGSVISDLSVDPLGNLTAETDANSATTQHVYDTLNRLDRTIDALTGVTDYDYDAAGDLTSVTAPNGASTGYDYDNLGNLIRELSPDRGTITYTHDDAGNVLTATDARAVTAIYTYDALNRRTSVSYPNPAENVVYTYDNPAVEGIGRLTSISDQSGTIAYTYDEFGNIVTDQRVILGLSYTIVYQYDADGNIASLIYPDGRTVTYGRNVIGEVTQVTSEMSGIPKTIVSNAAYEPFGPLSSLTYGNGLVFDYNRDLGYRTTGIESAGIADKFYSFDPAGNITRIHDGIDVSHSQRYDHDALNRLAMEAWFDPTSYAASVLADGPLAYWRLGESSGTIVADATGNGYDATYSGSVSLGTPGLIVDTDTAIRIDPLGAGYVDGPVLTGITVTGMEFWFQSESQSAYRELAALHKSNADRTYVRHVAEPDGRVGIVRGSSIPLYSNEKVSMHTPHHLAVWYESGSDTTYLMIDGVVQQDTYSGNLLAVNNPKVYVGAYQYGSTVQQRFLGELDEVALYAGAVDASTFSGRVSASGIGVTYGLGYDANGNRTTVDDGGNITSLMYQPLSNRLATIDGVTLQHDAAGNRTADLGGTRTFSYNDAGRLSGVSLNGSPVASYTYNALGQRTTKTVGVVTTVYLYDVFGHLIAEHDQSGGLIRDYVWMDDLPVAQIDQGEVFSYLHFDHLGSPRLATNDSQAVVWRWDSDAFGTTAANEDPDGDMNATTINLRFPGQYYDQETGLHYNYFRTYDPSTGRYLESDPIGLRGGLNTFAYVGGNPLSYVDPLGLIDLRIPGTTGQTTVHANPGPDATDFRPEHGPAHVHLGSNDGPRVRTDNFQPLTDADARRMSREQKRFCRNLTDNQKDLIRARQLNVFRHGRAILMLLATPAIALDSLQAACQQDPFFCLENTPFVFDEFEPKSCESGCEE